MTEEAAGETLGEMMKRWGSQVKKWIRNIPNKPTRFAGFEFLCIAAFLGLLYFINEHRGPLIPWPPGADVKYVSDKKRNRRIRREVAGLPANDAGEPIPAPAAKKRPGFKVSSCSECARYCSNDTTCSSYDCNPDKLRCTLSHPPTPPEDDCKSVEVDLLKNGKVTKHTVFKYGCKQEPGKKEKGWSLWGSPGRHPSATTALILLVLYYAISAWFFVYARSTDQKAVLAKQTFSNVFGKATVALLGVAAGTVTLAVGLSLVGAIIAYVASLAAGKGASGAAGQAAQVLMNFCLVIGGIALLYVALGPLIDKHTRGPYVRLIKNAVLYIPCLAIDAADWLAREWRIAPHSALVLLGLEALFLAVKFVLPIAEEAIINHGGKQILEGPEYLSLERGMGTFEDLHIPDAGKPSKFDYSYGLSAWFTLNPQPPNTRPAFTKFTPILNYGNRPSIMYNMEAGTLKVESEANGKTVTVAEATGVPMQTWNNVVVNYDAGTMDVFLNGVLIGSHPNISPFMRYETVLAGADKGLEGGICNVVYHKTPIPQASVRRGYMLLRANNPPLP